MDSDNAGNKIYDLATLYGVRTLNIVVSGGDEIDNLIYNLIKTPRFTRRFRPNTGSRLTELLHEPRDSQSASTIEIVLREELQNQVVRAEIKSVSVIPAKGGYAISVSYSDKKLGVIRTFEARVG